MLYSSVKFWREESVSRAKRSWEDTLTVDCKDGIVGWAELGQDRPELVNIRAA
jgi:hypothetical protein